MELASLLLLTLGMVSRPAPVDFDGDGTSEVVVYRQGAWFIYGFSSGTLEQSVWTGDTGGCVPVAMDYDGDRRADFTMFCSGAWHFFNDDGSYLKGIWTGGVAGDVPLSRRLLQDSLLLP